MDDLARLCVALGIVRVGLRLRKRAQRAAAGSGPSRSSWNDVISVSRPNSVMNHGSPAAGTIPSRAQRSRSAARSASEASRSARALARPRLQQRHRAPPGGERRVSLASVVAQPRLEGRSVELRRPVQEPLHRDLELPARAGLESQPVAAAPPSASSGAGARCTSVRAGKPSSANSRVAASSQCSGRDGATSEAARRAEVLHPLDREDVGEVGGELERKQRLHLAVGLVLDSDRLLEPAADEELAAHRKPARPAQLERREVRRRLLEARRARPARRRWSEPSAREARIGREQARGRRDGVQIAAPVADDERRAVEQGHARSRPLSPKTDAGTRPPASMPAQAPIVAPLSSSKKCSLLRSTAELDRLLGPHARRCVEPGDERRVIAVGVAQDLGELVGLLHVDEALDDVLDEHRLRLDLDVRELLRAECLDRADDAARRAAVAVPPSGMVERLRPDAERDRPPRVPGSAGRALSTSAGSVSVADADAADEAVAVPFERRLRACSSPGCR